MDAVQIRREELAHAPSPERAEKPRSQPLDGRLLVDGGRLTMIDEAALLAEAEAAATAVFRRAGIDSRLTRS